MSRYRNIPLAIIIIFFISGCKVNPTIKVPYVTYYRGDNSLLYFIKPMMLYESNNKMSIDFTFTDQKEVDSASVIVNYTLSNYTKSKNDVFYLKIDTAQLKLEDVKVIFEEMQKGERVIRYTSKIHQKSLLELLKKSDFQFIIEKNIQNRVFTISKKYSKKLKKTSNSISTILKEKFD